MASVDAAEIVVFGDSEVTQGAAEIRMVRNCPRNVTRFGFSDLGPVALEGQDQEVFWVDLADLQATRKAPDVKLIGESVNWRAIVATSHCIADPKAS